VGCKKVHLLVSCSAMLAERRALENGSKAIKGRSFQLCMKRALQQALAKAAAVSVSSEDDCRLYVQLLRSLLARYCRSTLIDKG